MVAMKLRQLSCESGEEEILTTLRRLGSPERAAPSAPAPTPLVVLMISASDFSRRLISWSSLRVSLKLSSAALVISWFCSAVVALSLAETEDSVICLSLRVQVFNLVVERLEPELARAPWN